MQKFLVGYDGSDRGNDALHLADALRTAYGGELLVAAVDEVEPFFEDFPPYVDLRKAFFESTLNRARDELAGAPFEERERTGSVPAALEEIARIEDVGMIVVGSTHRGRLGRILPGSVGARLLQGAPCAVAVAPVGYSDHSRTPASTVGVGFDGSAESLAALEFAASLAHRLVAELRVIAVARPVVSAAQLAPSAPAFEEAQRKHLRELLREALGTIPSDITATSSVLDGDPAGELARAAPELDLLVIGSRGYGPVRRVLLGGVARIVVETAACPVVVLPRQGVVKAVDADLQTS